MRKIILLTVTFNFTSAVVGPEFVVTQKNCRCSSQGQGQCHKKLASRPRSGLEDYCHCTQYYTNLDVSVPNSEWKLRSVTLSTLSTGTRHNHVAMITQVIKLSHRITYTCCVPHNKNHPLNVDDVVSYPNENIVQHVASVTASGGNHTLEELKLSRL